MEMRWRLCWLLRTPPQASPGEWESYLDTSRMAMALQTRTISGGSRNRSQRENRSPPSCRYEVSSNEHVPWYWEGFFTATLPSQIEAFEPTSDEEVELVAVSLWRPDMVTGMVELDSALKVMKADRMAAAALGHTLPSMYGKNLSR